ncbi:MAG: hypothetical protein HY587_01965 [Candidatus Omnitrophica bacterium]|nr:hypothetical protein [Candidatus Omnitrophota bacterium]
MKITSFFVNLCSVFILLTLGSLLTIISFHLVALEDLTFAVRETYNSPWKLLQLGSFGLLMIVLGLAFAKTLIKATDGSVVVYESNNGQVRVAVETIHETLRKAMKKYTVLKQHKIKIAVDHQHVEVKIKITLWMGVDAADFVRLLQDELYNVLSKLLGEGSEIEVIVDVVGVVSPETELVAKE